MLELRIGGDGLTGQEFVEELDKRNREALDKLGRDSAAGEAPQSLTVERLLKVALKNEIEATEVAAMWMPSTRELDVKLALARQCGDEAKHYRLIAERLKELGEDSDTINPLEGGYSPLFKFLGSIEGTPARIAAGQFTREGIAVVRNRHFIDFCLSRNDVKTAELYSEVIQKDELHHHQTGRQLLSRYCADDSAQHEAREAARRTLELAEEIQEMARLKAGISRAPGC
jgi:1,2-phenylacetyl-CoA epoxidase catalytic subunit